MNPLSLRYAISGSERISQTRRRLMAANDQERERFELLVQAQVAQDLEPAEIDGLFRRWSAMQKGLADLDPFLELELEPMTTLNLGDVP
jgi:hypothetical protein